MERRLAPLVVSVCLSCAVAAAQTAPNLSRQQRELLLAIVNAVDAAHAEPETADTSWQTHVLRASDGSHYVAFAAQPPAPMLPSDAVMLYVRLDSLRPPTSPLPRSPIREWLAGTQQSAPPPPARRGIAIGEMPVMGATSNISRGTSTGTTPTTPGMVDIQLLELERRRARERQEETERLRRAELERSAPSAVEVMPFEDFDMASRTSGPAGERVIARALTVGPGHYVLYAAWADPASPQPASGIRVIKKTLFLPPAPSGELSLSSVIVADAVRVRDTPYPPAEQSSHPYSIGVTDVIPSRDSVFRSDETLNVVFQVINPQASSSGKPDVEIMARVVRVTGTRAEPVAAVKPLAYSEANLPESFDLRRGHPLLAAMGVSLGTLMRGTYRLEILVRDRLTTRSVATDVPFSIAATAASLLKEAPSTAAPFVADAIAHPAVRAYLAQSLRPPTPSAGLQKALDIVAAGALVNLMVEESPVKGEEGVRAVLSGLAQLSVGDATAAVQLQRAVLLGAPIGPARLLSGAARALQSRDADAIAAWQEALKAGAPSGLVAPWLLDAYLRRGELARASALVSDTKPTPQEASWRRGSAALLIATEKPQDAVRLLDTLLAAEPHDAAALWLRLHALYAQIAAGNDAVRDRFTTEAQRYVAGKGVHAALAAEWLAALEP
jgi:hypothetical protein